MDGRPRAAGGEGARGLTLHSSTHRASCARPSSGGRFVTLDGMRGLAALCVAIYHFAEGAVFGGYLAVDFFFVLSGFVLMNTYGDRLAAGMSGGHFIKLRIVRIMPVYWLGLALCAMVYGVKLATHRPVDLDFSGYTVAAGLGAMMLPDPFAPRLFPLNPPAWSLFGEMFFGAADVGGAGCQWYFAHRLGVAYARSGRLAPYGGLGGCGE